MLLLCIFRITPYLGLSALTPLTMRLVLSCSKSLVLHQPIAFASHKYSGAAVNWDTFKQEAYALHFAVTQSSYYLRGKYFLRIRLTSFGSKIVRYSL